MSDPNERKPERDREAYEPPAAEDIDTTHVPAEVVAGGAPGGSSGGTVLRGGVEESNRWH